MTILFCVTTGGWEEIMHTIKLGVKLKTVDEEDWAARKQEDVLMSTDAHQNLLKTRYTS